MFHTQVRGFRLPGSAAGQLVMDISEPALPGQELGLFTDLYELTMAQAYFSQGMFAPATFSLSIRRYPQSRAYFVAAGLENVLDYLASLHFGSAGLDYLRSTGIFTEDFLNYLGGLRFTGSVRAIPEGRLFFTDEPPIEVTAPIIEAQLAETFILNQTNLQTLLATKASRCVWAARGRTLTDFASRRAQGTDAALKMARCSYIAGFQSTSNVLAAQRYGIPPAGTMAHSFISCFTLEADAFRAYAATFPIAAFSCWIPTTPLRGPEEPWRWPRKWKGRATGSWRSGWTRVTSAR
jgi:nicotinate phosphoribosyltransferase